MRIFLLMLVMMLLVPLIGFAAELEKVITYTNIHSQNNFSLQLRNDTQTRIQGIKVHADCGCVAIKDWPRVLDIGEKGNVDLSLSSIISQRKVNKVLVEGSSNFSKQFELINYFFSERPQVFGDTIIHLAELPPKNSLRAVVIIGDGSMENIKTSLDQNLNLQCELSQALEIKNGNGCYKRILRIALEPDKLLREGKSMVYVRIDEGQRLVLSLE